MQTITKRLSAWAAAVALLLLIPLVLTIRDGAVEGVGWNWSPGDFVFMFILLFGAGAVYELVSRRMPKGPYRIALGIAVVASVLLVWINAAVGLIGDGPINMLYPGVVVIGFLGAIIARLQPRGMSLTLFAMALAQMLVPVIALIAKQPLEPSVLQVFGLNAFFALLFVGSALLFRRASYQTVN